MFEFHNIERNLSEQLLKSNLEYDTNILDLVINVCVELGYGENSIEQITLGIRVMDIGLHINKEIFFDYDDHTKRGCSFLSSLGENEIIKNIVLLHHENDYGTGYPYGLSIQDIPLYARVVSLCREYTTLLDDGEMIYDEIMNDLETKFEKSLIGILTRVINK